MAFRELTLFTQFIESSPELSMHLVPSLDLPSPSIIEVCQGLPAFSSQQESMLLSNFEAMVTKHRGLGTFTWAASNLVPQAVKIKYSELIQHSLPPAEIISELEQLLKNPPPLLISDMGPLGFGLFAKTKIRKGKPVCTYMGRLIPGDRSRVETANRVYTVGVRTNSILTAVFQVDTEKAETETEICIDPSQLFPAFIDASVYGNYGSFLQHLPSHSAVENAATANLVTVGADFRHYPCYYFRASRDIEANEILGFDYGDNYWKEKDTELLFLNKYGEPIK